MLIHTCDDGVHYQQWVKEGYIEATSGNVIDYEWIFEQIEQDLDTFDVDQIAFDRWGVARVDPARNIKPDRKKPGRR